MKSCYVGFMEGRQSCTLCSAPHPRGSWEWSRGALFSRGARGPLLPVGSRDECCWEAGWRVQGPAPARSELNARHCASPGQSTAVLALKAASVGAPGSSFCSPRAGCILPPGPIDSSGLELQLTLGEPGWGGGGARKDGWELSALLSLSASATLGPRLQGLLPGPSTEDKMSPNLYEG